MTSRRDQRVELLSAFCCAAACPRAGWSTGSAHRSAIIMRANESDNSMTSPTFREERSTPLTTAASLRVRRIRTTI